jgi:RNA polymerase subunit RPABC4/transcription elongation factor Spt4
LGGALVSFAVYWLMLPWWVYLDARWRTAKAAPLAVFVFLTNFLGWLTYLVIRPEVNQICPVCVTILEPSFRACPHCGWSRAIRCRHCGRALRSDWRFCPYCEAARTDPPPVEDRLQ